MHQRMLSVLLLIVALGGLTQAADLGFANEGTIGWDIPLLLIELEATFAFTYSDDAFTIALALDVDATGARELAAKTALARNTWKLAATLLFDVPSTCFVEGELALSAALAAGKLGIELVRNDSGVGMMIALVSTAEEFLQSFALGLSVDQFGRVQTESCGLTFTYAAIEAGFACECADVTVTATFTSDGFSELVLRAADVGGLAMGIELGCEVQYTIDEKTVEVEPTFTAESPTCFDLYLGLVWDGSTRTLEGITLYGLGLACEIAGVRVRGLWELDPAKIALVKAPYWALLGFVWDVAAPCDRTGEACLAEASIAEASIAFFFGEQGLFDLGEILFGLEWPIAPGWTGSLAVSLETSGGASFVVGWEGGF